MLFMGTEVIEIQEEWQKNKFPLPKPEHKALLCLATRTNYSCIRGQYLRSVIYSRRNAFKLFNESISFLVILLVVNILGFLVCYLHVGKYLNSSHIFQLFLDLLTTAIPPTLPTAMSVGIGFAMQKLNQMNIRCNVKQKILVGGRVDTLLVEKSGILSKN